MIFLSADHMESPARVSYIAQPRNEGEDRSEGPNSPHRPEDHIIIVLVWPGGNMAAGGNSLVGKLVVMPGPRPVPLEISAARISGPSPVPSSCKTTKHLQQKADLST